MSDCAKKLNDFIRKSNIKQGLQRTGTGGGIEEKKERKKGIGKKKKEKKKGSKEKEEGKEKGSKEKKKERKKRE